MTGALVFFTVVLVAVALVVVFVSPPATVSAGFAVVVVVVFAEAGGLFAALVRSILNCVKTLSIASTSALTQPFAAASASCFSFLPGEF